MNKFVTAAQMNELAKHPEARWTEGSSGLQYLSVPANVIDRDATPLRHPTDPTYEWYPHVIVLSEAAFSKAPYEE